MAETVVVFRRPIACLFTLIASNYLCGQILVFTKAADGLFSFMRRHVCNEVEHSSLLRLVDFSAHGTGKQDYN